MKRKSYLLPVILLLIASAAGFFLNRVRSNIEVLTSRSLPAIRILGDLRDTVARLQISVLEGHLRGSRTSAEELQAYHLQLRVAENLIEDYRQTAANPRDEELIERVRAAFDLYENKVQSIRNSDTSQISDVYLAAHHHLQSELAELRNYRLGRVEDRVSTVERAAAGMWKTNFLALLVLIFALFAAAFITWAKRLPEPSPQDF